MSARRTPRLTSPPNSGRGAVASVSPADGEPSAAAQESAGKQARGERALIEAIRKAAARNARQLPPSRVLRLGIGDDCAILRPSPRSELVITTDLFLEHVHFRRDWHQPEVAGHRCLARGLSDIAAMGGVPVAAFLSFALPPELAGEWAGRFLAGLLRLARLHNVSLAGGDTAQAPKPSTIPDRRGRNKTGSRRSVKDSSSFASQGSTNGALFSADIVVIGSVRQGKALLRSGARPGDLIYVTGALGGAAAELALLERAPGAYAHRLRAGAGHPHLFPQPRLALGQFLLGRATAAIDLSDGLSTDLSHLCQESSVAAEIDVGRIPVHPLATREPKASLERALHGGEDYELLFTAAANRRLPAKFEGVPIRMIGRVTKAARGKHRVSLVLPDGSATPLLNGGWEHLRQV